MSGNPIDTLGLSCPTGGDVYICQDSTVQFLGCCGIDPCKDGSGNCPMSQLFESSFDTAKYHNILPQECTGSSGLWYTCTYGGQGDPFMGCCGSNPCSDASTACPKEDLVPARLNDDPYSAAPFITQSSSPPTSTPSTTDGTTTATTNTNNTPGPTQDGGTSADSQTVGDGNSSDESALPTGAIVGIAVGAVALLALIAALVFIYKKRRRRENQNNAEPSNPETSMNHPPADPFYSPGKDSHLSTQKMFPLGEGHPPPVYGGNSIYGGSQYPGQQQQQQQHSSPPPSWAAAYYNNNNNNNDHHNKHMSHMSSISSGMNHLLIQGSGSSSAMTPSEGGTYNGRWTNSSGSTGGVGGGGIYNNMGGFGGGMMTPQQQPRQYQQEQHQVYELSNEAQRHEIGG